MTKLQQIVKRAKKIRLAQPKKFAKWTDYIKAASKELAGKSVGSANLLPLLPFPKEKKQTGKTNIKIDKTKQAMAPGKRKASQAAKKPFYYESRANRSDKGRLLGIKIINDTKKFKIELEKVIKENFNRITKLDIQIKNHDLAIKNPENKNYLTQLKKQQENNKKLLQELKTHNKELTKLFYKTFIN